MTFLRITSPFLLFLFGSFSEFCIIRNGFATSTEIEFGMAGAFFAAWIGLSWAYASDQARSA